MEHEIESIKKSEQPVPTNSEKSLFPNLWLKELTPQIEKKTPLRA